MVNRYIDVNIEITPGDADSFITKSNSSNGQRTGRFKQPFALAEFDPHDTGAASGRSLGTVKPITARRISASEAGVLLFEALFQEPMNEALILAEAEARNDPNTGVRIRLSFDLLHPRTADVAALPWELMRRRGDQPLAAAMQTTIVRSVNVPKPIKPRPRVGPLRMLVIRSNPSGTGALNLGREGKDLLDALKRLDGIVVDEVSAPVQEAITDQLRKADYHVVHYMGHGQFDADRGGLLLLEKEDGTPHRVSASIFANWLKDEPLRLVFLNACETGTTPDTLGAHPFAGVAAALIQSNVPAVVAMQFPISDDAAIRFARTFYKCVAEGLPIDAAVSEGRKALFNDEAAEWATPVLYLRTDDGNLLTADMPAARAAAPPPPPAPPQFNPAPVPPPAPPQRDTVRTLGIAALGIVVFAIVVTIGDNLGWFDPDPTASEVTEAAAEDAPVEDVTAEDASAAAAEGEPAADPSLAADAPPEAVPAAAEAETAMPAEEAAPAAEGQVQ